MKTNKIPISTEGLLQWKSWGDRDPLGDVLQRALQRPRIFKNRDVMRSDYVPDRLPHRDEHIRRLGEILAPALSLSRPSNVFVYGKTGTGKTAVIRYVFKRFGEAAGKEDLPLAFAYVNCRISGTEYKVLSELCEAIGVRVPFTGLSKAEVYNRLRRGLGEKGLLLVACFDEVDALVKSYGDDLLYDLTRINEGMEGGGLSIVGTSNDLHFKDYLDPRVLSSLSEEELVFHPYTATELIDILGERATLAFREGAVPQNVINLCAALAAAEHGDARRAIDLLRVAAEVAERGGEAVVEERHVRVAQSIIERGRIFEALSTLPLHSKLLLTSLLLLAKNGVNDPISGVIYQTYREVCGLIGVEPLTDRRVSTLISELDMLGVVKSDIVNMGRRGRTRKIMLLTPPGEVEEVVENDEVLSSILNYTPSITKNKMKNP
ncbi:MAG: orc1/cdc6 family replication initiation protein [Nitrososphaerota archaeon]|nr:orc1/cdc6 family replication initiation protein [Nitrososphaerota archaeon]